jgi:hypothetical protein
MRVDECVDATDVGLDAGSRVRRQDVPGGSGRASRAERPEKAIGGDCCRTEDFRQPSMADAALKLHLPEAILRVRALRP